MTVSLRGPWTPRMRIISMSAVAEGPEMVVMGEELFDAMAAMASGTSSTTWSRRTRQM